MDTLSQDRLDRLKDSADSWFSNDEATQASGALVETAFLMAAADGELSQAEYEQLVATIEYITNKRFAGDQLRSMIAQLTEALQSDGWQSRIDAVGAALTDPVTRRNAYRLAAGVSFIDGEVQPDEERLFGLLAEAFEITSEEASQILVEVRDELFGAPDSDGPKTDPPPAG